MNKKILDNNCEVRHCNRTAAMIWYGYEVCNHHYNQHCTDKTSWNLFKEFAIEHETLITKGNEHGTERS